MDPTTSNGGKSPWNYALSGKIMLSAIVVLFTVVLLILFLHLYVRWHVIRRASRQARRRRRLVFSGEGQTSGASNFNRGLDPSILASLSVLLFSSDLGQDDEYFECAVCLNEFKEEEKIRCLPKCRHRFHVECIDMWFCSHSTCPLCRTAVEAVKQTAADAAGVSPTDLRAVSLTDSANNESSREEEMRSSSSDSGFREVRVEIPGTRIEVSSGERDPFSLGLESPDPQSLKSSSIRIVLIRWLLMRDLRIPVGGVSGSDADLERGERISPSSS